MRCGYEEENIDSAEFRNLVEKQIAMGEGEMMHRMAAFFNLVIQVAPHCPMAAVSRLDRLLMAVVCATIELRLILSLAELSEEGNNGERVRALLDSIHDAAESVADPHRTKWMTETSEKVAKCLAETRVCKLLYADELCDVESFTKELYEGMQYEGDRGGD